MLPVQIFSVPGHCISHQGKHASVCVGGCWVWGGGLHDVTAVGTISNGHEL